MLFSIQSSPILHTVGLDIVVDVGGLHGLEITPVRAVQVGELNQVGLVVNHVVTVRRAAQHVVDNGGHLSAGNLVVGTKVSIGIAADPAVAGRLGNVGVEPVAAGHVAEIAHGVLRLIGEGQGDGAELRPGVVAVVVEVIFHHVSILVGEDEVLIAAVAAQREGQVAGGGGVAVAAGVGVGSSSGSG